MNTRRNDWYVDVRRFHEKFGCHIEKRPTIPPIDVAQLRLSLISEEFNELLDSLGQDNLEGIADASADLIYVTIGLCLAYGIDLRGVWEEVQRTNMKKVGGGQREDGKILKPEGWTPPDIKSIIELQKKQIK